MDTLNPEALTKVQQDLQWVLPASESSVNALIADFQALTQQSETILRQAGAIVECVEGDRVQSVLPLLGELGQAARQFVTERLQATSGLLESVASEVDLLRQLSSVTEGQSKIALRIRILNIHTRIEVAHLGEIGVGFEYLARELADFSQSLAQTTGELGRYTDERRKDVEHTQRLLSSELPSLRQQFERADQTLDAELQSFDTGLAALATTPGHFRRSAEELGGQIIGVISAVQGHDITRQQLEHVCEGAGIVHRLLTRDGGADGDARASACAGLAVQAAQLKAIRRTISEWTAQVGLCLESIFSISASELVELGPKVQAQGSALAAQLARIRQLEGDCEAYGGRIRETLEGVSSLSQLVDDHMKKSEAARSRLQLLTFNSIVEATRLGAKADTICIIADDIGMVSSEWSRITERSASALDGILRLSSEIGGVMKAFAVSSGGDLREAQARIETGLNGLREAASYAVGKGREIAAVAESMRARCEEVRAQSTLLDTCFARIDTALKELEEMRERLLAEDPSLESHVDSVEVERLYAGNYTTEAERRVLRAALAGESFEESAASFSGNDVELF